MHHEGMPGLPTKQEIGSNMFSCQRCGPENDASARNRYPMEGDRFLGRRTWGLDAAWLARGVLDGS